MSQSESEQSKSEGVAQNQENILKDVNAHTINFAPSQNITNIEKQIIQERDETLYEFKPACPYKGLKRFNADDKDKFFGRDALIKRFLDAINSSPLSLILGASGSGKSSLVSAGIIPKLKDSLVGVNFSDFIVRLGEDPFASLYNCFLSHDKDYHESDVAFLRENSAKTLPRAIKQLKKPDQYWLFFIDQFEQLFTNPNNKVCDNFIDGLVKVANLQDSSVKIVLAMRADFLEYLSGYPALGKILNQNNIHLVTDMHPDELRQVIKEPARKHGVGFQEGLVEQIIKDVEGQKGSLPLLQYTLELLWKTECELIAADGRPHIADRTLNTFNYNALGGVRGALQKCVNEISQEQNEEEKLATKQIFLKLVKIVETDSGSRVVGRIASRSEFAGVSKEKVLKKLIDDVKLLVSGSKYVTKEDVLININTKRKQVATVELAHEILLSSWDALRRWLEEEKQNIILRSRLADDALHWHSVRQQNKSQARHELLKGSRLDEIVACRKADGFSNLDELSPIENEYIDASVAQRQNEIRQTQLFFIITGVAVIFMSGVTVFAIKQQKQAVLASIEAIKNNADFLLQSGKPFEARIEALKAGSKLEENNLLDNSDVFLISDQIWQELIAKFTGNYQNNQDSSLIVRSYSLQIKLAEFMQNVTYNEYNIFNVLEDSNFYDQVSFSPDGEIIIASSIYGTVQLWNKQGKLLHKFFPIPEGSAMPLNHAKFSPDGQTIASVGANMVKLWNRQGVLIDTPIYDNHVTSVSFSPDGETIASAGYKMVTLWNRQGKLLNTLTGHDDSVTSVSFSPDGETIASASEDKTVKLWNRQSKLLSTLTSHDDSVTSVSFSPDGDTIASASEDKTVKLWNRQGELLNTLTGHFKAVTSVSFSPDGETIASASEDKTVKLWNWQGELLNTLIGHSEAITNISFSPDGETIASASDKETVKLWNQQGKLLATLTGHDGSVNSVSFSPDRETIASASEDKTVKLWNRQGELLNILTHDGSANSVIFSPDGKTIASADENTVKLWNRQGELLNILTHDGSANSVIFSPDGKTIASADENTVKLWNRQGELLNTLTHDGSVNSVIFSPDGETIASADENTVKLWNRQGELLNTLIGHSEVVNNINFSPNGKTIASASDDNTVKLWNRRGELLSTLTGHILFVRSVIFSPDGETIVAASDNTIKLWNRQGKLLNTLTGHDTSVNSVSFSPNGKTIVSVSDNKIKLWNRQGQLLSTLTSDDNSFKSVNFSPDGETIAHVSSNGRVNLWSLNLKNLQKKSCEFLHDFLVTHPDTLIELTTCQNQAIRREASISLITIGENLAREKRDKEAIDNLTLAKQWNPELQFDPIKKVKDIQESQALINAGQDLAENLDIQGAIAKFDKAIELDPTGTLDISNSKNLAQKIAQFSANDLIRQGQELVKKGNIQKAINNYQQAETVIEIDAYSWSDLCKFGTLTGYAQDIIFACEKAVYLTSNYNYADKYKFIDNRGIARAMTGNIQGAIEDFEFFIKNTNNQEYKLERQQWVKDLKAGKNSFTPELRKKLLDESGL
jgi:WD40 repeat protein